MSPRAEKIARDNSGQTIALAGILQCAYLVDQIATNGAADSENFNTTINSLFQFDVQNPQDIYGGTRGVELGLSLLKSVLTAKSASPYRLVIQYALGIILLQKKASTDKQVMETIGKRLQHTAFKAEHFTDSTHQTASSCAAIYQDTISTFRYRIQIKGNMAHLQNSSNADNIRALLLAGIRAAVMWRQMGGRRWHLFFSRKRILKTIARLQAE